MIDFAQIVTSEMERRGWTAYRLAKEVSDKVATNTVYNLLEGKPVKSDTLAAVFDALDISVMVAKGPIGKSASISRKGKR